ncbi:MAG: peptide chain release factor N(5)-glutamine methyltransferase [candidate division KSB1 bacterium]|nr:peptide chain release factor N(5)-glutamine methyltransferase [candidate division KSB1 bacterium]
MPTQQKKKDWTVLQLLDWTVNYLLEKKFDQARLNTERLLAHALDLSRIELYTNFDRPLTSDELAAFKALLKRRLTHEPLQYIIGSTEFMSLPFFVNPDVLVPRPETEVMVEHIMQYCENRFQPEENVHILDVGTGSGCIAVSLAHYIPNARVTAVDDSEKALETAEKNAEYNHVEVHFQELRCLKPWPVDYLNSFHIVVSNPPYVSYQEFEQLPPEIKDFEPKRSLLGGNDGLEFYRQFSNILPTLLFDNSVAFFEIGEKQASSVSHIFSDAGFQNIQVMDDLAGKNRIVKMLWNRRNHEY